MPGITAEAADWLGRAVRSMPGITAEAADWLGRARAIVGVGTECPSIGKSLP
jgi:kynurenine formamidase